MVNNVEVGKVYWFIERYNNRIERCLIKEYIPEAIYTPEYWEGGLYR